MDKLLNDFTVHRPIGETWAVLTDVERIAPCLPGAQLQEIEGEIYRGVVKVKLGAISTAFKGQAKFVERDDERHVAVLQGATRPARATPTPTSRPASRHSTSRPRSAWSRPSCTSPARWPSSAAGSWATSARS